MKNILLILGVFFIYNAYSQNDYINQVLLLNEGSYDYYLDEILEPVTIGTYNPLTNVYNTIIEIDGARFASDLIIDEGFFYVAADNSIIKYDLDTYELISYQAVSGVRKMVVYQDYLILSRGDYDSSTGGPVLFDSYLEVYLKSDLSYFLDFDTFSGPQWSTESLLINDDKLYVAINNAYEYGNYKGIIGIVDLNTLTYLEEIDLGENGNNPINMMYKDNFIYTINNKNWDGSSISRINSTDLNTETINLSDVSSGCGVSIIRENKINYQINNDNQVYKFNLDSMSETGLEENLEFNYYAFSENPINTYLYASISNFVSNSEIVIYNQNNDIINSFFSGVATGKIVFDIRNSFISDLIEHNTKNYVIQSLDLLGRETQNKNQLMIEIFNNGNYKKIFYINN